MEHVRIVSGLRDRIQFDGAAVPVSWFVEQEKLVFLWRTGTMMVLRVVVSSCLHLLPTEKMFVVVSVTPWSTQDPSQALESVSEGRTAHVSRNGLTLCCFVCCQLFFAPSQSLLHDMLKVKLLETLFGCASRRLQLCETQLSQIFFTGSTQNVLNVVHQQLSRVLIVGSADFRCWLQRYCLVMPRDLPTRTVFRSALVVD